MRKVFAVDEVLHLLPSLDGLTALSVRCIKMQHSLRTGSREIGSQEPSRMIDTGHHPRRGGPTSPLAEWPRGWSAPGFSGET